MDRLYKLNKKGEYTTFPGVTVISPIDREQIDLWRQVHACISESAEVRRYYAPLPSESYHMTAVNLCIEDTFREPEQTVSWESFLTNELPFFHAIDNFCKEHPFTPVISVLDVDVSASIRLVLEIPHLQEQSIAHLAKHFDIENCKPQHLHMTLAYQYQACSQKTRESLKMQLREQLIPLCNSYPNPLKLQSPTLCYFHDMQTFIPWDGVENPFIAEHTPTLGRF